jgi:transcriptional regulator with XRE-family HTH domain
MRKKQPSKTERQSAVPVQRSVRPLARFGQRLREVREQERMTQAELAQKAGMTAMHVSHFECGRRLPSLENFAAMMRVLGDHSEYLLELERPNQ